MRLQIFLFVIFLFALLAFGAENEGEKATKNEEKNNAEGNEKPKKKSLSNGFLDEIDWVEWNQAESLALDLDRPIFLLIHKTWCRACGQLKTSFETTPKKEELIELSKKFVMANVEDEDEPEGERYAPDGAYIPRLFFFDKTGERLEVNNKKNYPNNAYYFPQVPDVIKAMQEALRINSLTIEEHEEANKEEEKEDEEAKDNKETDIKSGKDEKSSSTQDKKVKETKTKSEKEAEKKKKENKTSTSKKTETKKSEKDEAKKSTKKSETKETEKKEETPKIEKSQKSKGSKTGKKSKESEEKAPETVKSGGCPHAAGAAAAKKRASEEKAKKEEAESKRKNENKKSSDEKKKSTTKKTEKKTEL